VVLRGGASDVLDGGLSGSSLSWTLNGSSAGNGQDQLVSGLAPGIYTATLTAQNSIGLTRSAQTAFSIGTLFIPSGGTPTLDGSCDDPAYANAATLALAPYPGGGQATARLLRTASALWVCFSGLTRSSGSSPGSSTALLVDVNDSGDALAQPGDYSFDVGEDGSVSTGAGDGAGGYVQGPGGLTARTSADAKSWNAELVIDAGVLGGWNHLAGLNLSDFWLRYAGDDYRWPYNAGWNQPSTWARAYLGDPRRTYLPSVAR
jgi:hypothetical protein